MAKFDPHLLDRALAGERKERERLRLLDESPVEIDEAILFGSVVSSGRFDAYSDIAIPEVAPHAFFTLMGYFEDELRLEVNLVTIDFCPFAETV